MQSVSFWPQHVHTGRLPSHFDFLFRQATHAPSVTVRLGFWGIIELDCGCTGASWSMGAGWRGRKLAIVRQQWAFHRDGRGEASREDEDMVWRH